MVQRFWRVRLGDKGNAELWDLCKSKNFQKLNGFIGHGHVIEVEKIKDFSYGNLTLPKVIFRHCRAAVYEIRENHKNFIKINNFIEKNYL